MEESATVFPLEGESISIIGGISQDLFDSSAWESEITRNRVTGLGDATTKNIN